MSLPYGSATANEYCVDTAVFVNVTLKLLGLFGQTLATANIRLGSS
jgi:hypothetical protein